MVRATRAPAAGTRIGVAPRGLPCGQGFATIIMSVCGRPGQYRPAQYNCPSCYSRSQPFGTCRPTSGARQMTERTGGCLCGDVRFRLVGAPYQVRYCHCQSCRKHTGAPVSVFADCKGGVVEFTKGAPRLYESSPGVHRGFCARCGSTLNYETDALAGEVHVQSASGFPDRRGRRFLYFSFELVSLFVCRGTVRSWPCVLTRRLTKGRISYGGRNRSA